MRRWTIVSAVGISRPTRCYFAINVESRRSKQIIKEMSWQKLLVSLWKPTTNKKSNHVRFPSIATSGSSCFRTISVKVRVLLSRVLIATLIFYQALVDNATKLLQRVLFKFKTKLQWGKILTNTRPIQIDQDPCAQPVRTCHLGVTRVVIYANST